MRAPIVIGAIAGVLLLATTAAAEWNQAYSDPWGDVSYANIDITSIRSYERGDSVVVELRVLGAIESTPNVSYSIRFGSLNSSSGILFSNGLGTIRFPDDTLPVCSPAVNTFGGVFQATLCTSKLGDAATFRIFGIAERRNLASRETDIAGPGYSGSPNEGSPMLLWTIAIIAIAVPIGYVSTFLRRRRTAAKPNAPRAPRPGS
ncbi:MAG TPA: hypothetical protein VEM95_05945 [Thermoplasmata archaeon]|nr:hypothetical protein [Thermoplasmata archaeon]